MQTPCKLDQLLYFKPIPVNVLNIGGIGCSLHSDGKLLCQSKKAMQVVKTPFQSHVKYSCLFKSHEISSIRFCYQLAHH